MLLEHFHPQATFTIFISQMLDMTDSPEIHMLILRQDICKGKPTPRGKYKLKIKFQKNFKIFIGGICQVSFGHEFRLIKTHRT